MSYGGNADPSGIQVTFLDQTGAKSVKAVIAFSVPVSRIIPNIITKMNLPATSPDGQPMSYSLDHKEGGRRLLESWTLVEAGVQNGDHLIVYPEVVAGRLERTGQRRSRRPDEMRRLGRGVAQSQPIPLDGSGRDPPTSPRFVPGRRTTMYESPRIRRLHNDLAALERLRTESSVFRFTTQGNPPQHYQILFQGRGLVARSRARSRSSRSIASRSSWVRRIPGPCPRSAG